MKETPPNVDKFHAPSAAYRERCDGTLGEGPFRQRGTVDGFLRTGNDRPDASRNLVMLGGSFVESMFVDEHSRFPSIVERALSEQWRVLNGGYSGMTTLHMLPLLTSKIPTVMTPGSRLLLFIGQSDVNAMGSKGAYWADSKTLTPVAPDPLAPVSPWGPKESVERTIDALLSVADSFGFDYGVVASPFRDGDFSSDQVLRKLYRRQRDLYERATGRRRFIQQAARAAAEQHDVPFFDAQPAISNQHMYDSMHLNITGQHVFAEAITEWISKWAVLGNRMDSSEMIGCKK